MLNISGRWTGAAVLCGCSSLSATGALGGRPSTSWVYMCARNWDPARSTLMPGLDQPIHLQRD